MTKKEFYLKVALLLIIFSFTCLNFIFASPYCLEAENPSRRCASDYPWRCENYFCIDHGGCDYYYWDYNECDGVVCYEWWYNKCNDGYSGWLYCANPFLWCPFK